MDYSGADRIDAFFAHHGIKGQKWGVRRFQNEDGSLTELGKKRYGSKENFEKIQQDKKKKGYRKYVNDDGSLTDLGKHLEENFGRHKFKKDDYKNIEGISNKLKYGVTHPYPKFTMDNRVAYAYYAFAFKNRKIIKNLDPELQQKIKYAIMQIQSYQRHYY